MGKSSSSLISPIYPTALVPTNPSTSVRIPAPSMTIDSLMLIDPSSDESGLEIIIPGFSSLQRRDDRDDEANERSRRAFSAWSALSQPQHAVSQPATSSLPLLTFVLRLPSSPPLQKVITHILLGFPHDLCG